jgi:DNA-binding MarR family transcriptional regulator
MATVDYAKKFAEQAGTVQQVLRGHGVIGDAGRIVMVLVLASRDWGVSQRDAVTVLKLPKDVVSKLVGSLVQAGLLTKEREGSNSRIKRLQLTDSGRALLFRVREALQSPRPTKQEPEKTYRALSFFDDFSRSDE